jgi:hypothetical protein
MLLICSYVDATWFKSTVWSIGNWCSFRRLIRTNNDCEGWHRRLNHRTGKSGPPLYVLIPILHRESKLVTLQLQMVSEHRLTSTQRRASKDNQEKLAKLWDKYEKGAGYWTSRFLSDCVSLVPF